MEVDLCAARLGTHVPSVETELAALVAPAAIAGRATGPWQIRGRVRRTERGGHLAATAEVPGIWIRHGPTVRRPGRRGTPFRSSPAMTLLDSWARGDHTADGTTHPTYRKGTGPGVIVIDEIPGLTPEVIGFAEEVVAAGFTVVLPHLFGEPEALMNPLRSPRR